MSANDIWTTDATVLCLFSISTAFRWGCSAQEMSVASLVNLHTTTPVPKEDVIQRSLGGRLIKAALTLRNERKELAGEMAVAFINTDEPLTCTSHHLYTLISSLHLNSIWPQSATVISLPLCRRTYASYIIISSSRSRCSQQRKVGKGASN